jgi:hypothetical protein
MAIALGFCGSAGASPQPINATALRSAAPPANATIVAQHCRCVERHWNGFCKLRVCRDR